MARVCDICGKGNLRGRRVTFSGKRNPRIFRANIQTHWLFINGRRVKKRICNSCWKKMKKGASPVRRVQGKKVEKVVEADQASVASG